MTVAQQWLRLLTSLDLREQPDVLVCAPDDEGEVLAALSRARARARVVLLHIDERSGAARSHVGGSPATRLSAAALRGGRAMPARTFDAALFDHALDDIIVDAVARHDGIEHCDHRVRCASTARAVRAYWLSGDLVAVARPAFLHLLAACANALKPAASLVFSHRISPAHLPHLPMDLYTDCLALARSWLLSSDLPFRQAPLDGLDPHWWMRLELFPPTA